MSRDAQHRTRAERNEQFAEELDKSDPLKENWAVVAAFYSALHYIEQFFVKFGTPCSDHTDRDEKLKGDARIRPAYENYKYLYSLGHTARYKPAVSLPEQVYQKHVRPCLLAIKKQVDHAIQQEAGVAPAPAKALTLAKAMTIPPEEPPKPTPGKPKL